MRIEDYALLGDTHSAALVSKSGSIDWMCLPRFDSGSCFAALLGKDGGHWRVTPTEPLSSIRRRYRPESMVLETEFTTRSGKIRLTDCLPVEEGSDALDPFSVSAEDVVVRIVECLDGRASIEMDFAPRFDYGHIVPWIRRHDDGAIEAVGGPDALDLRSDVPLEPVGGGVVSNFELEAGDVARFVASYHESQVTPRFERLPEEAEPLLARTDRFWRDWAARCGYEGKWREAIARSLLTLKALTYSPTGGIVASPTTSLPEAIGGVRNWDYRYCWLRDATFTLSALLAHGYESEASQWRDWLLRAVAGDPEDLQIMYGVKGERRLSEWEIDWLEGYEDSRPVRIGNAAHEQFQLDVYGEVMDTLHTARKAGIPPSIEAWGLQRQIVDFVCENWQEPDEGIWEVRSDRRQFVHSKVMAWVAIDRGIRAAESQELEAPLDRWRATRDEIRKEVFARGLSSRRGCFVRAYDDDELDASLLMLPLVGFVSATEPPMLATIDAIAKELVVDGFVMRYLPDVADDGLPPGEGSFLMCSFWLVCCLGLSGREEPARELFERLLSVRNDVGLLSEQFDAPGKRLVGNFPQAFSHTALLAAASVLTGGKSVVLRA